MYKLGIVGAKNAGKTTLIEQLIPKLDLLGCRCATIKHTAHDHTFDIAGKDSWKHRTAGALVTIAVSQSDVALYSKPEGAIVERLMSVIERDCDICLVEGDKSSDIPKLLLTRNAEQISIPRIKNVIATYGPLLAERQMLHFPLNAVDSVAEYIVGLVDSEKATEGITHE